jgi:hypothetical protein
VVGVSETDHVACRKGDGSNPAAFAASIGWPSLIPGRCSAGWALHYVPSVPSADTMTCATPLPSK